MTPRANQPSNYGKRLAHEPLTPAEATKLLAAAQRSPRNPERWYAIVGLLLRTGCRSGELLSADLADLDLEARTLTFRKPKGFSRGVPARTVGLDQSALESLEPFLLRLGCNGSQPLFPSVKGGTARLSTQALRKKMTELGKAAGIPHRVHAHGCRATCAIRLLAANWTIAGISSVLGHRSLSTTLIYLARLPDPQAISALQDMPA